MTESIWVVTYWEFGTEPVVTAFNNEEAAIKCYDYFKKCYDECRLDECPIYSIFSEKGKEK